MVHTICLNKYGAAIACSYTVTLITSAKSRRILLMHKACSVRSSETIFQMPVFASFQLPKLSVKNMDNLLFLFNAFSKDIKQYFIQNFPGSQQHFENNLQISPRAACFL
jgi:hypothetical protein